MRPATVGRAALPRVRRGGGRGVALLRELRAGDGLRVKRYKIAVIPGDGIGPEVIEAAMPVLDRAAAKHGFTLAWERLPTAPVHTLNPGGPSPTPPSGPWPAAVAPSLRGASAVPEHPGT